MSHWKTEYLSKIKGLRSASLATYANKLRRILSMNTSSGEARKRLGDFLSSIRAKESEGGWYSSLGAMIDAMEHHWDGLFFCYDDPRIPRTDNGLEITIRHEKTSYRRMTGMRSWDSYIAQYRRSAYLIPPDVTRDKLVTMAGDVDRKEYMKRWKEFKSRRGVQSLMRTAGNDYTSSLGTLEQVWNSL